MEFNVEIEDFFTSARSGRLLTNRGVIKTPVFMPIGTYGVIKTLSPRDLETIGISIILANAFHLYLRPGETIIREAGGLHSFMGWNNPILTDSGGFQVFSLAELRQVTDEGVIFKSNLDGSEHKITPEKSMEIQRILGSDIIMSFDECPSANSPKRNIREAVFRTANWANRCVRYLEQNPTNGEKDYTFFPIIQGGVFEELRRQNTNDLLPLIETGVAIGGLAVGEAKSAMFDMVSLMDDLLPRDKVRYLMGVGKPQDIIQAVSRGMDMFDCVIPTRNARNGQLFTWKGKINIQNKQYQHDFSPVDENCSCYGCTTFSRAYLRHLFNINEIFGLYLASLHNVTFYQELLSKIRQELNNGSFFSWSKKCINELKGGKNE